MINLEYEGTKYVLEMSRNAVQQMESNGFVLEEVQTKPMTMIPELIYGAFIMHHSRVKRSLIDEIYASIDNKEEFITALLDMYADTLQTLTEKPSNGKNVTWKTSK